MQFFYMMVGIPGSGKSWYAENKLPNATVHSSDAIREEILGDVTDQSGQHLVFQTLHDRALSDLRAGKDVVYDATNIDYKRRMSFLHRVTSINSQIRKVCIFMATPYTKCVERNANRGRNVPESVIDRMYRKFDIPMWTEGWDEICAANIEPFAGGIDTILSHLSGLEHDNPHHRFTVGQHMLTAYEYFDKKYPMLVSNIALGRAVALHDIGKEHTKVFCNAKGEPTDIAHFYNHERVGAYESLAYTNDLPVPERWRVALLIRWHMAPFVVKKSDNPNKTEKKFKNLLGEDIWNQIMILNDCDRRAH